MNPTNSPNSANNSPATPPAQPQSLVAPLNRAPASAIISRIAIVVFLFAFIFYAIIKISNIIGSEYAKYLDTYLLPVTATMFVSLVITILLLLRVKKHAKN